MPLVPDVIGEAIEISVQLRGLTAVDPAIRAKRTFLVFDVAKLAIQPACFPIRQRTILDAALDAILDTRLTFVDARGALIRAIVAILVRAVVAIPILYRYEIPGMVIAYGMNRACDGGAG